MLIRDCAGGIVFLKNQVLLIQNEKEEWSFPKGVLREDDTQDEVAVWRVKDEADIDARIVGLAGRTSYEFYSISRRRPVANRIVWYLMVADKQEPKANEKQGILQAKFFDFEEALKMVTYSQDKSLLTLAFQKFKEINEVDE